MLGFADIISKVGITPELGLNIVKNELEKQLGKPIVKFQIIYKADIKRIDFRVFEVFTDKETHRTYEFTDGKKLIKIIEGLIKEKLTATTKDPRVDIAIITHTKTQNIADVFYTTFDGKKEAINYIL